MAGDREQGWDYIETAVPGTWAAFLFCVPEEVSGVAQGNHVGL